MSQYAPSFTHFWNACRTVKAWEIVEVSDILVKIAKHTIGIGYALRKYQPYIDIQCITCKISKWDMGLCKLNLSFHIITKQSLS